MAEFFINLELDSEERYDFAKFLDFSDNFDPLTASFLRRLKDISYTGEFVVQSEEARPDIISNKIYGSTQYWWILLFYNDIISFEDLANGVVIKYPDLADVEDLFFSLKADETAAATG